MSPQLSSVPGGGNILIILIAGIRVLVYDRKKEAGEHTTSTTPSGFSIRSCILRNIFRTDATLSHLRPSLIYLRWFLVMQASRVYPTCCPSLDQGLMMQESKRSEKRCNKRMVGRYDFWIKRYARCPALAVYYGIYSTPIYLS